MPFAASRVSLPHASLSARYRVFLRIASGNRRRLGETMASHSILLKASMLHLGAEEKRTAMQSLAILGLARYASHTGGNTAVDTATLQKLHGEDNAC